VNRSTGSADFAVSVESANLVECLWSSWISKVHFYFKQVQQILPRLWIQTDLRNLQSQRIAVLLIFLAQAIFFYFILFFFFAWYIFRIVDLNLREKCFVFFLVTAETCGSLDMVTNEQLKLLCDLHNKINLSPSSLSYFTNALFINFGGGTPVSRDGVSISSLFVISGSLYMA